jgi:undecaprenyl pyrophosphate phosphatase UppP
MSIHLTYAQAVVTGLVQGVTELFPVSSLGHNVLLPALIGGNWAKALSVSAPNSPYLAFVVGLHVATAVAMIAYFWRDWLRIVRGFISSLRTRSVSTPDERLAWMIILATIPVGIVGLLLQKVFINVFAKPELTAVFLAINGLILLYSERQRRARDAARGVPAAVAPAVGAPAAGPQWGPAGGPGQAGGYGGYSQQPRQQQWQGPDDPRYRRDPRGGQDPRHGHDPRSAQDPWGGQSPWGDQEQRDARYGQDNPRPPQDPWADQDLWGDQAPRQGYPQPGYPQPGYPQPGYPQPGYPQPGFTPQAGGRQAAGAHRAGDPRATEVQRAVAADRRLSTMGYGRAMLVGAAQILALLPGISRDGIVTVAGMGRGLSREDAVRYSFLLSAPVILAAGVLKVHDLFGPMGKGIHGPVLVGSLLAAIGAYLSIRFLTRYFSEERSLNPFGIYCLVAGIGSLAYLVLK